MDLSQQIDEMLALQSILGNDVFICDPSPDQATLPPGSIFRGEIRIPVEPIMKRITLETSQGGVNTNVVISALSPVVLRFELPEGYPSEVPPVTRLQCRWLSKSQIKSITDSLHSLFVPGSVILFTWITWLQENVLANKAVLNLDEISDDPNELMTWMIKYDLEISEKAFSDQRHTCPICLYDLPGSQCFRLPICKHIFCLACLKSYLETHITEGSVKTLRCPDTTCNRPFLPQDVQALVNTELYQRYETLLLQSALNDMNDIIWCPRPTCRQPVLKDPREKLAMCNVCGMSFCVLCEKAYHGVDFCRRPRKLLLQYMQATDEERAELEIKYGKRVIQSIKEEIETTAYLAEHAKPCPRCSTYINRESGCNKMTCSVCSTYFCYECGAALSNSNPYGHFNMNGATCVLFAGQNDNEWDE